MVRRSDWYINELFSFTWMHIECYSGDYKDQKRKSLTDMSVQEYNINRYDYKKWNSLRVQFLLFL